MSDWLSRYRYMDSATGAAPSASMFTLVRKAFISSVFSFTSR